MGRLAILHHDLEWSDASIAAELIRRGHDVEMWDIRCVSPGELRGTDLVLNRVYASVGNRDFSAIQSTIDVVSALENMSLRVLNPLQCCLADYSKFASFEMMRTAHIPTPATELIRGVALEEIAASIWEFSERVGMPVVVKRNTSGRAVGVMLVTDAQDINESAEEILASRESERYNGDWIVQEFVISPTYTAFRFYVNSGFITSVYRRGLVKSRDRDPFSWISSLARGSVTNACEASVELADIAMRATKAICADINALDIAVSQAGLVVIESNPTPNFAPEFPIEIGHFADGVERVLSSCAVVR